MVSIEGFAYIAIISLNNTICVAPYSDDLPHWLFLVSGAVNFCNSIGGFFLTIVLLLFARFEKSGFCYFLILDYFFYQCLVISGLDSNRHR